MNPNVPDPKTGFMTNFSNSGRLFTAEKKVKLLENAMAHVKQNNKFPTMQSLAESVGISLLTFELHLRQDENFAKAWREIKLHGQSMLEGVMFENGQRPSGYMDRITWLRRHFPEHWNPEYKVSVSHTKTIDALVTDAKQFIDADIVEDKPQIGTGDAA